MACAFRSTRPTKSESKRTHSSAEAEEEALKEFGELAVPEGNLLRLYGVKYPKSTETAFDERAPFCPSPCVGSA